MTTLTFAWDEFREAGGIPRLAAELEERGVRSRIDHKGLTVELEEDLSPAEARKMVEDHMSQIKREIPPLSP